MRADPVQRRAKCGTSNLDDVAAGLSLDPHDSLRLAPAECMPSRSLLGMKSKLRDNLPPHQPGDRPGLPVRVMDTVEPLKSYQ